MNYLKETKNFLFAYKNAQSFNSIEECEEFLKKTEFKKWGAAIDSQLRNQALRISNGTLTKETNYGFDCNSALNLIFDTVPKLTSDITIYSGANLNDENCDFILASLLPKDLYDNYKFTRIYVPKNSRIIPIFSLSEAREIGDPTLIIKRTSIKRKAFKYYVSD